MTAWLTSVEEDGLVELGEEVQNEHEEDFGIHAFPDGLEVVSSVLIEVEGAGIL